MKVVAIDFLCPCAFFDVFSMNFHQEFRPENFSYRLYMRYPNLVQER